MKSLLTERFILRQLSEEPTHLRTAATAFDDNTLTALLGSERCN